MKRFIALAAVLSVLLVSFVACGQKEAPEAATVVTEAAQEAEGSTFTGVLEDKKDFMITVTGEDGTAYVFNLEGVECPAEVGDTVTVTYTGDMTDFDAQLMATEIVKQ